MGVQRLLAWGVALTFVCASGAKAQHSEWAETFTTQVLGEYFDGDDRVLVVGAGDGASGAGAAKAALAALRHVPVALAMDSASLGEVTGLTDHAIVERAASLPVDEVMVIRVFPGPEDGETVVAVVYDLDGNVQHALNGSRGVPLGAAATPPAATQGLTPSAAASVAALTEFDGDAHARAVAEYEEKYVHFGAHALVHAQTGQVLRTSDFPVQGKYGKKLSWRAFYEAVERPDLVDAYDRRVRKKRRIAGAGFLALATGITVIVVGVFTGPCDPDITFTCLQGASTGQIVAGSLLMAGGLGTAIAGLSMRKDKRPLDEKRRVADEYNTKLRRRLGLADDLSPAPDGPQPEANRRENAEHPVSLAVLPAVSHHRWGLNLGLRF